MTSSKICLSLPVFDHPQQGPAHEVYEGNRLLPYHIHYSPEAETHLKELMARQRAIVLDKVDNQLTYQPTVETKNRKPMKPNPLAEWELRIGDIWVYYRITDEPEPTVLICGVGIKLRNAVYLAGKKVEL